MILRHGMVLGSYDFSRKWSVEDTDQHNTRLFVWDRSEHRHITVSTPTIYEMLKCDRLRVYFCPAAVQCPIKNCGAPLARFCGLQC